MDLALNSDQITLVDSVRKLTAPFRAPPPNSREILLSSKDLEQKLLDSGFRDVARLDGMGPLEAVLIGEVVHALPYTVDYIAPALLAHALDIDVPGPVGFLQAPANAPARNLAAGGTALIIEGEHARMLLMTADMVEPVEAPYAYTLGRLKKKARGEGVLLQGAGAKVLHAWRLSLVAELGASARAAIELTVAYVNDRRQFGKPIGAYQAVQHRLSECMVAVHGVEALVRRAAALGDEESVLAAMVFAKESCARIIYDTHQFQGAIGLTYEYPLHYYTYRLRLLHGELGSSLECGEQLALKRWRDGVGDWSE